MSEENINKGIDPDHEELVGKLTSVVLRGDCAVDEIPISGFSEPLRSFIINNVRQIVAGIRKEIEDKRMADAEVAESDDVTGGMMTGENTGGYRCVSIGTERFVGSPKETALKVQAYLEQEAAKGADLGPVEVDKLMEIVGFGADLSVFCGKKEFVCEGFEENGIFFLSLYPVVTGSRLDCPVKIIGEINSHGYAKIKAIKHVDPEINPISSASVVDKSWIKKFLEECKMGGGGVDRKS